MQPQQAMLSSEVTMTEIHPDRAIARGLAFGLTFAATFWTLVAMLIWMR